MASLVRTQILVRAETGVPPEFGNLVETGIDSRGDALPFGIARAQQQDIAARFDITNQRPDSLYRIGGYQRLLGKYILQLLEVFVGEAQVMRLFDPEAAFFRLANSAAASTFHAVK